MRAFSGAGGRSSGHPLPLPAGCGLVVGITNRVASGPCNASLRPRAPRASMSMRSRAASRAPMQRAAWGLVARQNRGATGLGPAERARCSRPHSECGPPSRAPRPELHAEGGRRRAPQARCGVGRPRAPDAAGRVGRPRAPDAPGRVRRLARPASGSPNGPPARGFGLAQGRLPQADLWNIWMRAGPTRRPRRRAGRPRSRQLRLPSRAGPGVGRERGVPGRHIRGVHRRIGPWTSSGEAEHLRPAAC